MKILAITQARVGSTRLPEKILKKVGSKTLLEIHLERILLSKLINKLKVATTIEANAIKIVEISNRLGIEAFQGSIDNVLERFYFTAKDEKPDWVVRLTSDCPLIDSTEIDKVIQFAIDKDLDYASNTLKPTLPDGMDVEVFKFDALKKAYNKANLKSELEHVTPYIWKNSTFNGNPLFSSDCLMYEEDYSGIRLTVDTQEDFEVISKIIEIAGTEKSWKEYVQLLEQNPDIKDINKKYGRNEGYEQSLENDNK